MFGKDSILMAFVRQFGGNLEEVRDLFYKKPFLMRFYKGGKFVISKEDVESIREGKADDEIPKYVIWNGLANQYEFLTNQGYQVYSTGKADIRNAVRYIESKNNVKLCIV